MVLLIVLALLAGTPASAQQPLSLPDSKQWFYDQRAYPSGEIPEDALQKALLERQLLEQQFRLQNESAASEVTASWSLLGPTEVSSPQGIVSGRVTAIVTDSRNPETVYIGAAGGGVWRSTDGGGTWQSLGDDLLSLVSGSLALDERTGTLYYGTGDHGAGTYGAGVLRSHDGGATWISSNGWDSERNKPQFRLGTTPRILLHPDDPQTIFLARSSGLWRSTDGGDSWFRLVGGVATDVAIHPDNPSRMFLALGRNLGSAGNGVYRSDDGGNTWGRVAGLPFGEEIGRISLAVAPSNGAVVYAVLVRSQNQQLRGVYRSVDGGDSWNGLPAPLSLFDSNGRGHGFFDNFVAVDPRDANVAYLGGVELWKTINGGLVWVLLSLVDQRIIHEDQFSIAFKPADPDTVYIGNDGGIYKTTDGGATWASLNSGLPITQINSVAVHPQDPQIALAGTQDQGLIRFAGSSTWEQLFRGDAGAVMFDPVNPNIILTTKNLMRPRRSVDGGASFSDISAGIDPRDRGAFYPPVVASPENPGFLYFGTHRVWNSIDGGATWVPISPDLTDGGALTALAVSPGSSSAIWAGSSDGRVHVSTGLGFWHSITGLPRRWVTSILPDPRNPGVVYLTVSGFGTGHIFKITGTGNTLTDISGNLPNAPANAVAIDERGPLYVATDVGVFRSEDGTSWASFNAGLPNAFVTSLALDTSSGTLTAGTFGRSAYRGQLQAPESGPNVLAQGVVNSATYQSLLAPGGIASLFGTQLAAPTAHSSEQPLPTSLEGVSVTVNGEPAPLFVVSPLQINFQVPFKIVDSQALVQVSTTEGTAAGRAPVLSTSPGIFDGTIAHGATGTPVDGSNPAARGEILVLFATGLGATQPEVASGSPAPSDPLARTAIPVTARFGDQQAPVHFAGLAPGFVGLYQVNIQVPEGVSGDVPLTIQAGGRSSNAVIVSIRP